MRLQGPRAAEVYRAPSSAMRELLAAFLHVLFPSPCRVCRRPLDAARRSVICGPCWHGVRPVTEPFCPRCGRPFGTSAGPEQGPDQLCGACRERVPAFSVARAAVLYEAGGTVREAIMLFKYGRRVSLSRHLGRLMADAATGRLDPDDYDGLVPVPLHPGRERERGFNQSALLAREVGRRWGVGVEGRALRRARPTHVQSGGRREREANVEGAFQVMRPDRVEGRRLLVIDDVFTTGATVNECARTLVAAGAADVAVYTLARAA
jgi:ComF family protein